MNLWIIGDSALRSSLITFNMDKRTIGWLQESERIDDRKIVDSINNKSAGDQGFNFWLYWGLIAVGVISLSSIVLYLALNFFGSR